MDIKSFIQDVENLAATDAPKVLALVNGLMPVAVAALSAVNPAAGGVAAEVEKGIHLAEDWQAAQAELKAGYTLEQWQAFVDAKQADDDAIMNM